MNGRTGFARWAARVVVLAAAAAALEQAVVALVAARSTYRYAIRHADESLEAAQDRVFGAEYMASVRAVKAKVDVGQTLLFVDDWPHQQGWSYFALYQLAPRKLRRFGSLEELERGHFARKVPKRTKSVLVVPGDGAPLRLLDARDLQSHRSRAHQARP